MLRGPVAVGYDGREGATMISFVIPAHNEALLIGQTLRAVVAAAEALGEPYEVVVANDASTDDTRAIAESAGTRVIDVNHRQIAATRNAGAAAAAGDYLLFIDADTLLPAETLQNAWAELQRGAVACGAEVVFEPGITPSTARALAVWNWLSRTMRWAAGAFIFVRREAFDAVGGFDARYYAGEEIFLSEKLGLKGVFAIVRPPVITSARKERTHGLVEQLAPIFRAALTFSYSLRRRDGLDLWYDGQREQPTDA